MVTFNYLILGKKITLFTESIYTVIERISLLANLYITKNC